MLLVSWFLCGILYTFLYCYLFFKLVNKEKFIIDKKIILVSVIFSIIYCLILKVNSGIMQPYLTHILMFLILLILYKKSIVKTLIGELSIFIILFIIELVYGYLFLLFFNKSASLEVTNWMVYLFSNCLIFLLSICFSKIDKVKDMIVGVLSWYRDSEFKSLSLFVTMAMTIGIVALYNTFINSSSLLILLCSNLFCLSVFVFVIGFFKEKSNNTKISVEYDQLLDYVKVYEDEIEEKSKNQHEYKNQLIVIKNLVSPKNKKAIEYIDKKLDSEIESEDRSWLSKLKYVPQGGLKGLIYYKIQEMLKNNVIVFVDISPQLREAKDNKNINKYLEDISKIIGVYLDNAIQAVNELSEKYIILEFYLEDDNIVFSLSNNYRNKINFDKVDKEGYTTKGYEHGYGLSLVKDIISNNYNLTQKREMNGIYYVQKLYIKK